LLENQLGKPTILSLPKPNDCTSTRSDLAPYLRPLQFHLEKEEVFVVVVSTTGDGDPPDNVSKFWRKLKKKTLASDHLACCNYALLGMCMYRCV
jgi:sulfite reductase alpha subunit-like flavoprotein